MNILGSFIKALTWGQRYSFSFFYLHYNDALKHIKKAWALCQWTGLEALGGYTTVIGTPSLPGNSVRSFDKSGVTFASWASTLLASKNAATNIGFKRTPGV